MPAAKKIADPTPTRERSLAAGVSVMRAQPKINLRTSGPMYPMESGVGAKSVTGFTASSVASRSVGGAFGSSACACVELKGGRVGCVTRGGTAGAGANS